MHAFSTRFHPDASARMQMFREFAQRFDEGRAERWESTPDADHPSHHPLTEPGVSFQSDDLGSP